jgi:DivIVA domain-containing protein
VDSARPVAEQSSLPPQAVARRTFAVVRRGYDPDEVRAFLRRVAASLDDAIMRAEEAERRVASLEREVRSLRSAPPQGGRDDDDPTDRLGSEAARILKAAHQAAAETRRRAEEEARRTLESAQARAEALIGEGEAKATERLADADTTAGKLIEAAREEAAAITAEAADRASKTRDAARAEGRSILRQTNALRAEILADLVKRRKALTIQVEQLHAGRDRLASALEALRAAVNESADQFARAEEEARLAARAAGSRAESIDFTSGIPAAPEPTVDEEPVAPVEEEKRPAVHVIDETGAPLDAVPRMAPPAVPARAPASSPFTSPVDPAVEDAVLSTVGPTPARPGSVEPSHREGPAAPDPIPARPQEPGTAGASGPGSSPAQVAAPPDEGEGSTEEVAVVRGAADQPASMHPRGGARPVRSRNIRRRRGLVASLFGSGRSEGASAGQLPPGMRQARLDFEEGESAVRVIEETEEAVGAEVAPSRHAGQVEEQPSAEVHAAGQVEERTAGHVEEQPSAEVHATGQVEERDAEEKSAASVLFSKLRQDVEKEKRAAYGLEANGSAVSEVGEGAIGEAGQPVVDEADGDVEKFRSREEVLLERRNGMLDPLVVEMTRRVKRVLQDEQNELMDQIREGGAVSPVDLLGPIDEQEFRYRKAVAESLLKTCSSGALFVTGRRDVQVSLPDDLVGNLASSLVGWLRSRLSERYASAGDGSGISKSEAVTQATSIVTSTYRECRTSVLDQAIRDSAIAGFSRGMLEGLGREVSFRWVVDDAGRPCPDCDDNALAGPVRAFEEFPTGQAHPPAHPGCRCLLVPDRQ